MSGSDDWLDCRRRRSPGEDLISSESDLTNNGEVDRDFDLDLDLLRVKDFDLLRDLDLDLVDRGDKDLLFKR